MDDLSEQNRTLLEAHGFGGFMETFGAPVSWRVLNKILDAARAEVAAPEPLRVAGEEVERLRNEIERLEADATVEDIVVAGLKPERDKFDAGERSNLNMRFVRGALDAEANAKRWRQMASDLRSVLALIDARPPVSEEVEKAAAWLEETVADYCDPDSAFRAAELLRRLALIEPSAGKDFGADLSQLQPAESGEGTQPSPTKDTDRACDYIRELANDQVGCGLDPIGFLIASHGAVRGQRDTAQELVRAWEGAVSSLEAHIMDRAAMKDPANPETYLSILRSEIAGVQRRSEQCLASRWHDYKSQRSRIEALEAERDALLAGGVKPSPAADDGLSDSHEQVVEQQRSEPISSPSDAQSVRPDGGEG